MSKLLTVKQVLGLIPVSKATFFRVLRNDPRFPAPHVIGSRTFYDSEEIKDFIAASRDRRGSIVAKLNARKARHKIMMKTRNFSWVTHFDFGDAQR